jgi:transcriptional regulator with XRE-family HTH domain
MSEKVKLSAIEQHVVDFVIELRVKHNLKQEDIATIIGAKRTFITNVESGKNRAKYNLNHIDKIADHFGLSPKDFLPEKANRYM